MFDGLSREYDVIIIGTGLIESVVAAACARIGKSVLHIDTNEYYGTEWASFTLDGLVDLCATRENISTEVQLTDEDESFLPIANWLNLFEKKRFRWHIEQTNDLTSSNEQITVETLRKQSRKFNIDLTAKLYYSTGGLVDLLVQSNVTKYCEFKLVSRLLIERDGKLENVPSSREDVFNSNDISLIDKRLLMKVLTNCSSMNIEDLAGDRDIPFIEYLKKQKLNSNLCHLILNSISMVDYNSTTGEGFIKVKRYLESTGRYGKSPFLYPLYGNGEMSQCFSRLCAVFAGIYFLRFPLAGLIEDKSTKLCKGIISNTGERFHAKEAIICNHSFVPSMVKYKTFAIHRSVLITNKSIKPSEKEEITYLRLTDENLTGIDVIEVGNGSGCTPEGYFLLYIFHSNQPKPEESDDWIIEKLLQLTGNDFNRTNILGEFSFDQTEVKIISSSMSNLFITPGPDGSINHDQAVISARNIFEQIYSKGEQFLPRAPDPEDIIIEETQNAEESTADSVDEQ